VLILDEPTSQLDPIAATDFLAPEGKINRELGTTVIMTEHRLEEGFPISSRVLVMDEGKLICSGPPRRVGEELKSTGHSTFLSMPAPMRIYAGVPNEQTCPITVRDGRLWLDEYASMHTLKAAGHEGAPCDRGFGGVPEIELDDVWFKYNKDLPDVLRGLSFNAFQGEFLTILGGNGTGKTTTLSVISGANKPYRGKVSLEGKPLSEHADLFDGLLGVLPQNPQALFVKKTVREDLLEMLKRKKLPKEEKEKKIASVSHLCRLEELVDRHPYDLSGGEQQRAALAKVLLLEPKVLLLDEPTKGLDAEFKQVFAQILQSLLYRRVTIVMVSHDIEFCAKYAHRCAMFFDGGIVAEDTPRAFFSGNSFYTTAANRMARHLLPDAVTAEDVILSCGGTVPPPPPLPEDDTPLSEPANAAPCGNA
jgi:energy-coupling factor transport system ATP-binding protein